VKYVLDARWLGLVLFRARAGLGTKYGGLGLS